MANIRISIGKDDPFKPEVVTLRVPIRKGEVEFRELTLQPPVVKDILRTDGHHPESVAYAVALLSSMSGVPESALHRIALEDWADLCVALSRANMRFMGVINLLDKKEGDENEDPTEAAATPPPNFGRTSAA